MVKTYLIEKVGFEQRLGSGEAISQVGIWGKNTWSKDSTVKGAQVAEAEGLR